jgi:IPT/TIG domain/PASTA domain
MKLASRSLIAAVVAAAALSLCGSAGAAIVTVGPNLSGIGWESEECGIATTCTFANYELGGTGVNVTSPVTGAIVGFNVLGGSTPGTYRLRTLTPGETAVSWFLRNATAPIAATPNAGIQAYAASLPIKAGDTIGLTASPTASVSFMEAGQFAEWETEPPESGHSLTAAGPGVVGFNAEVQPAPTIVSLGTTSGPTSGGTSVSISGTDFENATAVTFGSASASFTVESEGRLTAVSPANATAGSAPVTVTTIAGKATASPGFNYEAPPVAPVATTPPPAHCVVPNLSGKKLPAAKQALVGAKCKLGTVKKLAGATAKSGKVSKQGSKPGSKLAVGSKVAVTLKPAKPVAKKHGKK